MGLALCGAASSILAAQRLSFISVPTTLTLLPGGQDTCFMTGIREAHGGPSRPLTLRSELRLLPSAGDRVSLSPLGIMSTTPQAWELGGLTGTFF